MNWNCRPSLHPAQKILFFITSSYNSPWHAAKTPRSGPPITDFRLTPNASHWTASVGHFHFFLFFSAVKRAERELSSVKVRRSTFHLVLPREKQRVREYNKPTATSNSGSQGHESRTQPSMNNMCRSLNEAEGKEGTSRIHKWCEQREDGEKKMERNKER